MKGFGGRVGGGGGGGGAASLVPRPMSVAQVVQCQQFLGKVVVLPSVAHNRK